MRISYVKHLLCAGITAVLCLALFPVKAADLNPAAVVVTLPKDLKWVDNPSGSRTATLFGDPTKPGMYAVVYKWLPHKMSRPHRHPKDRFIQVLEGTWWNGTGAKYDPDSTVPVRAGSFVTHHKDQIHYDGAKDEEATLLIFGEGPANATPAEVK